MPSDPERINKLLSELADLQSKMGDFENQIDAIRKELYALKAQSMSPGLKEEIKPPPVIPVQETKIPEIKEEIKPPVVQQKFIPPTPTPVKPKQKSNIEKFIGENLLNKIGIAITIIGVGIGAKYAIDHQLISPLARIIIGYIIGFILAGFGFKLKKKYKNFSAVLVSGSIAIMYFITYFARSLYSLLPLEVAFSIMVLLTVIAVIIAIYYDRQVIAHIGLVGAYGVPFLLGDNSGNVRILFTYTAIINAGILAISFTKYWKPLLYSSFGLTWLMFFGWYLTKYTSYVYFDVALVFVSIYFAIFYLAVLAFKLIKKEKTGVDDGMLIVVNAFLFFGIGFNAIWSQLNTDPILSRNWLSVFTFSNGLIHFIIAGIVLIPKNRNKNLLYVIQTLAIIFITISVPVYFKGSWIWMIWSCEAALLFAIGRFRKSSFYEVISWPMILTAFIGCVVQWFMVYSFYFRYQTAEYIQPLLNINFMNGLISVICFSFIVVLNKNKKWVSNFITQKSIYDIVNFCLPAILIATIYYTFRVEIAVYFEQLYDNSAVQTVTEDAVNYTSDRNYDYKSFKMIWIINYSLLFSTIVSFINMYRMKNRTTAFIGMGMSLVIIFMFLTQGLYQLAVLRDSYVVSSLAEFYHRGPFNIGIRYISLALVGLMLGTLYAYIRRDFVKVNLKIPFEFCFHAITLWILSSEIIYWMNGFTTWQSYKLGLTILWGVYSLMLIVLGIAKRKLYLRITAIVLFAITLIKLFLYDIADLDTISKTIMFIALGLLLLVISFLYIKYKHIIFEEKDKEKDESPS